MIQNPSGYIDRVSADDYYAPKSPSYSPVSPASPNYAPYVQAPGKYVQTPTKINTLSHNRRLDLNARDELVIKHSRAELASGDTAIYILPPNVHAESGRFIDANGESVQVKPHRMHRADLEKSGSPKFIPKFPGARDDLFSKVSQDKVRRRLGLKNLPEGVQWVLDLTPPTEGDEAVNLIAVLSCSTGVLNWYRTGSFCGAKPDLIGGNDEPPKDIKLEPVSFGKDEPEETPSLVEPNSSERRFSKWPVNRNDEMEALQYALKLSEEETQQSPQSKAPTSQPTSLTSPTQTTHTTQQSPQLMDIDTNPVVTTEENTQLALEYCPLRHRGGLHNLLLAMAGRDSILDSAPKVWTLQALARQFECEALVVSSFPLITIMVLIAID